MDSRKEWPTPKRQRLESSPNAGSSEPENGQVRYHQQYSVLTTAAGGPPPIIHDHRMLPSFGYPPNAGTDVSERAAQLMHSRVQLTAAQHILPKPPYTQDFSGMPTLQESQHGTNPIIWDQAALFGPGATYGGDVWQNSLPNAYSYHAHWQIHARNMFPIPGDLGHSFSFNPSQPAVPSIEYPPQTIAEVAPCHEFHGSPVSLPDDHSREIVCFGMVFNPIITWFP